MALANLTGPGQRADMVALNAAPDWTWADATFSFTITLPDAPSATLAADNLANISPSVITTYVMYAIQAAGFDTMELGISSAGTISAHTVIANTFSMVGPNTTFMVAPKASTTVSSKLTIGAIMFAWAMWC